MLLQASWQSQAHAKDQTPQATPREPSTPAALPSSNPIVPMLGSDPHPPQLPPPPLPHPGTVIITLGAEASRGSHGHQQQQDLSDPVSESLVRAVLEEMRAPAAHHLPQAASGRPGSLPPGSTEASRQLPHHEAPPRLPIVQHPHVQLPAVPSEVPPVNPQPQPSSPSRSSSSSSSNSSDTEILEALQRPQARAQAPAQAQPQGPSQEPSHVSVQQDSSATIDLLTQALGHLAGSCDGPEVAEDLVARVIQELLNSPVSAALVRLLPFTCAGLLDCCLLACRLLRCRLKGAA